MTTLKNFAIVAALLAGGTSLAMAQNGPQTPTATGGAAGNPAAPAPSATKHHCTAPIPLYYRLRSEGLSGTT